MLHYQVGDYSSAATCFRNCLDLDPWSRVSHKLAECVDLINDEERRLQ
jgi:hypothetical protein